MNFVNNIKILSLKVFGKKKKKIDAIDPDL